jgi:hypothetical protein
MEHKKIIDTLETYQWGALGRHPGGSLQNQGLRSLSSTAWSKALSTSVTRSEAELAVVATATTCPSEVSQDRILVNLRLQYARIHGLFCVCDDVSMKCESINVEWSLLKSADNVYWIIQFRVWYNSARPKLKSANMFSVAYTHGFRNLQFTWSTRDALISLLQEWTLLNWAFQPSDRLS